MTKSVAVRIGFAFTIRQFNSNWKLLARIESVSLPFLSFSFLFPIFFPASLMTRSGWYFLYWYSTGEIIQTRITLCIALIFKNRSSSCFCGVHWIHGRLQRRRTTRNIYMHLARINSRFIGRTILQLQEKLGKIYIYSMIFHFVSCEIVVYFYWRWLSRLIFNDTIINFTPGHQCPTDSIVTLFSNNII